MDEHSSARSSIFVQMNDKQYTPGGVGETAVVVMA
jgi:hypothetical protein